MKETCLLCGGRQVSLRFVKEDIPYYRCSACRFQFSKPASNPNRRSSMEEFEPAYVQYLQEDKTDRINFDALYRWMTDFDPLKNQTLLDLGCGSGKLVRYLRGRGIEAFGLEPCDALYRHFLPEPWFFHGDLDSDNEVARRTFDVVTAFDVLEHVEDPVRFLSGIGRLLKPDGKLFLSTPDLGSLTARCLGRRWHFFCPYHLVYFSRQTLTPLARELGLELAHFSRRGRYRSVGYTLRYFFEFFLRRKAPRLLGKLDGLYVPINLHDTMYCCFAKVA